MTNNNTITTISAISAIANALKNNKKIAFEAIADEKKVKLVFEFENGSVHLDNSNGKCFSTNYIPGTLQEKIEEIIRFNEIELGDEIPVPDKKLKHWVCTIYDPEDEDNYWSKSFETEEAAKDYGENRDSHVWPFYSRW